MRFFLPLPLLSGLILLILSSNAAVSADLLASESLGEFKYGQKEQDVLRLFGRPASKGKDVNWDAIGEWVQEWKYPDLDITLQMASAKQNGPRTVLMIRAGADCKLATARGIKIGSPLAEVRKAYGNVEDRENRSDDSFVAGSVYGGIIFTLKNGKVTEIFIGAAAE